MELAECYRLLELNPNADLGEIKASYRRLARRYHPDVNPNNRDQAHRKFIQLTEAYELLLEQVSKQKTAADSSRDTVTASKQTSRKQNAQATSPPSDLDYQVKWEAYEQLQTLLQNGQMARATTLVESLSKRFPRDSEVRQWQAITYQQRGRQLVNEGNFDLATTFLNKALSTDPHNRSLWYEVDRDFQRIDPLL
jgi:curved DNA-binding protein CbpA